jgi:hypothetical protein
MEQLKGTAKMFIGSATLALVLTLVSQALGLYGLIDTRLARWFLVVAWLVAVTGTAASDHLGQKPIRYRVAIVVIFALAVGSAMLRLDRYVIDKKMQQEAYTKPPNGSTSAPGPRLPIIETRGTFEKSGKAAARLIQHSEGPSSPNIATFGNGSPITVYAPPTEMKECRDDKLANCSPSELRFRALQLKKRIDELVEAGRTRLAEADEEKAQHQNADSVGQYQDWLAKKTNALRVFDVLGVKTYRDTYRDAANSYRNEIVNRLGNAIADGSVDYDTPFGWMDLERIAQDLSRLAESLPKHP